MINPFKQARIPRGEKTALGMAGFDNPRENIDPHVKTKVIDTKEIVQDGVHYDLSVLTGFASDADLNSLSGAFFELSGANYSQHAIINNNISSVSGAFYVLSGANANQHATFTNNISSLSGSFFTLSGANQTAHAGFGNASYSFGTNNFSGTGNFTTTGNITISGSQIVGNYGAGTGIIARGNLAGSVYQLLLDYNGTYKSGLCTISDGSLFIAPGNGRTYFNAPGLSNQFYAYDYTVDANTYLQFTAHGLAFIHSGNTPIYFNDIAGTNSWINTSTNFGIGTTTPIEKMHISGGALVISNKLAPTNTMSGAGALFVSGGALHFKGSSGTITLIANA